MNANLQKILLATLVALVLLALLPSLVMSSWQAGAPMMFGMMGGMVWIWISALLIFGLGLLTGWAIFAKK